MASDRDRIFSAVQAALAPLPQRSPYPEWEEGLSVARCAPAAGVDLWEAFCERFRLVHGVPVAEVQALRSLLETCDNRTGYCDPALLPVFAPLLEGFQLETTLDRSRIDDYAFGITQAWGAIAETGSLILTDRTTSARLGALAPWIHVAVVDPARIWPTVAAALAELDDDPSVVIVTGPSKTADIEGILIEGVHGPGVQVALRSPSAR